MNLRYRRFIVLRQMRQHVRFRLIHSQLPSLQRNRELVRHPMDGDD